MSETVILIGGPPGGGKTTLSRALGARLDRPSLTIDDLRTGILGITTREQFPNLHLVGLPDAASYFSSRTVAQLIDDASRQHTALWPAIASVIHKRARHGLPAVIDGWHLIPSLVASLEEQGARGVWLDVAPEVLEERERKVSDFYAAADNPELMFERFLGRSITWNDMMAEQAGRLDMQVIRQTGGVSPEELCDRVLAWTG